MGAHAVWALAPNPARQLHDLRTKEGRRKAGLVEGTRRAKLVAARQEVHLLDAFQADEVLGNQAGGPGTISVELSDLAGMWMDCALAKGFAQAGWLYDPEEGRGFVTFATAVCLALGRSFGLPRKKDCTIE